MFKDPKKYQISIVVLGSFNPTIIQPLWLANKKLIREEENEKAKIAVIHNDLTQFSLGWANFSVTPDRFEVNCSAISYFEPTKDLVLSIFDVLRETPVKSFGINHLLHYDLDNLKSYTDFGSNLALFTNWNKVFNEPRLMEIQIQDGKREDKRRGYYNVTISPSEEFNKGQQNRFFILVNINDHYDDINDCSSLRTLLDAQWESSQLKAQQIINIL